MSVLEIVLLCVSSLLTVCLIVLVIAILVINKATTKNVMDYKVLNPYAPINPIVFLGDSLTDLYPVHEFIHDVRIVNRGVSGDTTYDLLKRLDDVVALKPKTVILQIGINDYVRLHKSSPLQVSQNIIKVVQKLQNTVDDIRLVSLYPINKNKLKLTMTYLWSVNNKTILETNKILSEYCSQNNLQFINLYPLLLDENQNLNEDYTLEGLHLNLAGYDKISPVFKQIVEEIK